MFIPSCLQLVCIESSLILNPHRLLSGKWSGNVLSSFIWLKVLFSFNLFSTYRTLLNRFLLKKKPQTDLNWTWHFGCCLRFFFNLLNFFSLFLWRYMLHATCFCFSPHMWRRGKRKRGQIPPRRRGGKIKHHMMGAVIASQTTERIKNPLPSSRVLLPHPLPLMELLPCLS